MSQPRNSLPIEVDLAKDQDFGRGRGNTIVDTLVIHTTEGSNIAGAARWWDRDDVIASAHYILDGKRIVARVAEGDTAFHAGHRGMNLRSIGIEVVGHCADRRMWTPEVMAQLVTLSAEIVQRHGIPVVHQPGPGICGHCDVPDPRHPGLRGGAGNHTDPGAHFPLGEFLEALRDELTGGPLPLADVPEIA
jgi:N-acetyl-anhydromuramyl-L-alanine amidase AmpD